MQFISIYFESIHIICLIGIFEVQLNEIHPDFYPLHLFLSPNDHFHKEENTEDDHLL